MCKYKRMFGVPKVHMPFYFTLLQMGKESEMPNNPRKRNFHP